MIGQLRKFEAVPNRAISRSSHRTNILQVGAALRAEYCETDYVVVDENCGVIDFYYSK